MAVRDGVERAGIDGDNRFHRFAAILTYNAGDAEGGVLVRSSHRNPPIGEFGAASPIEFASRHSTRASPIILNENSECQSHRTSFLFAAES
jgi:hypothetical protein